ncbi:MAG TPA: translation initiation factor IF-2 N-terminal domain-containing protein, partial [Rhodoferax sp.]|nr:translation initiation factor IF-2 N-terminal domain-containing protein [Rhodoferax sp.]
MSSMTVAEFANELKKSPDTLLEQLKSAGVAKAAASDKLTESDKQRLLSYLQLSHGTNTGERKKITLVKKSTTEIKQADATGKARTIQVEVRKKRTFVRRDDGTEGTAVGVPDEAAEEETWHSATLQIDHAELARREEEARRQAELIRRQEDELAERRRQREAQEAVAREAADRASAEAAERALAQQQTEKTQPAESAPVVDDGALQAAKAAAAAQAEASKQAQDQLRLQAQEKAALDSKNLLAEEQARAADLNVRRQKAESEAAAIRLMMSQPGKKLPPKKEEPKPVVKPAEAAKAGIKGTLHKPAGSPTGKPATAAATTAGAAAGAGKEVKSAKLSSSWAGDPAKKKGIPTRGDTGAGAGRGGNWRGGPRGRRGSNDRGHDDHHQAAPVEVRVLEVHVPETITVAELAHKMAVKASEVIKHLMKLGQMVTINQPLD